MPEYPRSPFKKLGDAISPKVEDDLLELDNNVWIRWVNYAGTDIVNAFKVDEDNAIPVGAELIVGPTEAAEDSGLVTIFDMPVSATPAAGTKMGAYFKINGDNVLSFFAFADSSGGVTGHGVTNHGAVMNHRTDAGATDYNPSILTSDCIITVDNSAAARAITISTEDVQSGSIDNPRIFILKDEEDAAGTYPITVSLESGTIDGNSSKIILSDSGGFVLYVDGTNGYISAKACSDAENYGEAYIYNNANPTVIETANTPIALRQIVTGLVHNFIFDAGSTAGITIYADYSGTVAGTVLVTSAAHGLATGDVITIRGSTNYNGAFEVTVVSASTFYITDTWAGDDGASDWDQGTSLTVGVGAAGLYPAFWQMSTAPAAAAVLTFNMYINATIQAKSTAERKFPINDLASCSSSCVLDLAEGDIVWLAVSSDGTANITNKHGNFNIRKL